MMQSGRFGAIAATFVDAQKAKDVFNLLLESGFEQPWMAVIEATPDDAKVADSSDGVMGAIGRFFGGTSSLRKSLVDHGISDDEAEGIDASIEHGGAVVVVGYGQRIEVAISLLEREGGTIRSKPAADYDPRQNIDATVPGQGDELNRGSGRGNSGGGLGESTGFWSEHGAEKDMKANDIGGLGDGARADSPSKPKPDANIETFYRKHDGTRLDGTGDR